MFHHNRRHQLIFLGICLLFLTDCIEIGKVFQGNTRRRFGEYDIDDRQEYKRYLRNISQSGRERDREIIRRMQNAENESLLAASGRTMPSQGPLVASLGTKSQADVATHERHSLEKSTATKKKNKKNDDYPWLVRVLRRLFRAQD